MLSTSQLEMSCPWARATRASILNAGLPKWKLWRMAGNVAVDTAVGAIPVAGDAFDLFFKSNTRNLKIVKRHLDKHHPQTRVIEQ